MNIPARTLVILQLLPLGLFSQEFDLSGFLQEQYINVSDSVLLSVAHDSLQYEISKDSMSGVRVHESRMVTSSDGLLVLFQFEGEGCGAYCNPFFNTVAISKAKEFHTANTVSLDYRIESIEVLESGRDYLVMGMSFGRARGIEAVWGRAATLVRLEDSVQNIWAIQSYTSNLVEVDNPQASLLFDAKNQSIELEQDWYSESDDYRAFHKTALYLYNGETFIKDQVDVNWSDEEGE